jgi:hypothetical protein
MLIRCEKLVPLAFPMDTFAGRSPPGGAGFLFPAMTKMTPRGSGAQVRSREDKDRRRGRRSMNAGGDHPAAFEQVASKAVP